MANTLTRGLKNCTEGLSSDEKRGEAVGSVVKYSAVITKLRGMYSKLLRFDDFVALSSMTSVGEVVGYLKSSPGYSGLLSDVNETTVHRGTLEHLFSRDIINDAEKLSAMLGEKEKNFLRIFLSKYEIEVVKKAVRNACRGGSSDGIADAAAIESHKIVSSGLNMERCFAARSLAELRDALAGTEYERIIGRFTDFGLRTPMDIGTALDEFYFKKLQRGAKTYLSASDSRGVNEFISAEIDVFNILWIYRYKKYYDMTTEEIVNHIMPNKNKINRTTLYELAACDIKEFPAIVEGMKYRDIFKGVDEKDWDRRFSAYLYRMYHRQLRKDSYNFSTVLAYLYLKEMDINNIITVVEGVRYGVAPEKIIKYIDVYTKH